ncbi:MAG: TonB-dependent receptor [Ignavibacteriales bacterium]|nr:TonB-dependent receptor [Ignavibacteriales bacterium]
MYKIVFIIFIWSAAIYSQNGEIHGTVKDESGLAIIGANVIVENTLIGTATDSKGNFKILKLKKGNYIVSVSMIGYSKVTSEIITLDENVKEIDFVLTPLSYTIDQLIITANKYAKDIRELAASSYILDQKIFSEKNFLQIDDALRYVPGITMTDDQISIRGSSGYSRGAGTRVLVAMDGIPIYTPDSGDIVWELVPVNEIGRVEIIKGSASSLYGSSAIGGVVNIISKEISSNPVTFVKIQNGIYDTPSFDEWKWTDKLLSFNSQTISHSRSFDKLSLSGSITRFEDYSYRKNDYQLRFGGFLKSNYQFSESTSLSLIGTGYTRDRRTFIYWKDLNNALSPADTDIGQSTNSDRTIVGLNFNHKFSDAFSLSILPNAYISYWTDDSETKNSSDSKMYRTEIRSNYSPDQYFNLVSGFEFQYNNVSSNIFGTRNSNSFGAYSQADYKLFEKLNLSFGLRYDFNKLADLESTNSVSPKLGINYKVNEFTTLRGLASKGFRAPTLAEAFTSTTTSGVTVKPNPNILPETSYSFELGINHIFSQNFMADLSIFNNEYYDMIEPGFDPADGQLFFNNVTRARIQGIDFNSTISIFSNLNLKMGYIYLWARDIENKLTLKYRPKHSAVFAIDFDYDLFEAGIDFRYLSRVENIDFELVDLGIVPDGDKRVEIYVVDLNAGINLFSLNLPFRIFFNLTNLLNYNYVELIGNIAPIRNYSLNIEAIF